MVEAFARRLDDRHRENAGLDDWILDTAEIVRIVLRQVIGAHMYTEMVVLCAEQIVV